MFHGAHKHHKAYEKFAKMPLYLNTILSPWSKGPSEKPTVFSTLVGLLLC
jgi:hypothetical protein